VRDHNLKVCHANDASSAQHMESSDTRDPELKRLHKHSPVRQLGHVNVCVSQVITTHNLSQEPSDKAVYTAGRGNPTCPDDSGIGDSQKCTHACIHICTHPPYLYPREESGLGHELRKYISQRSEDENSSGTRISADTVSKC
jgi:hypothetical protein